MRVRHRRSLHHGVVHIDSAVVTAMSGDTAARRPGTSGVMMMVVMLLRLRLLLLRLLLLVQRIIVQMVMMVPAVQRARARLIIIVMPGAR